MWSYNTLVVLAGAASLGLLCALVGTFAVLRRQALLGDALAHATLPGLCLAFLLLGVKHPLAMPAGALATGLLGVLAVAALQRWGRLRPDAALGVVLSVFYGAGVMLSRVVQNHTTAGSKAGLERFLLGSAAGMVWHDVALISLLALAVAAVIVLGYRVWKVMSFDSQFALALGLPVSWLDGLLMALVALTVVAGLPAAGAVMVAALLVLPVVSARLWVHRLETLVVLSCILGVAMGAAGVLLSASRERLPTGPTIVLVGGACFAVSLVASPQRGLVVRLWRLAQFRRRLALFQLLQTVGELQQEQAGRAVALSQAAARLGWPPSRTAALALQARLQHWLAQPEEKPEEKHLELTPAGREQLERLQQQLAPEPGSLSVSENAPDGRGSAR